MTAARAKRKRAQARRAKDFAVQAEASYRMGGYRAVAHLVAARRKCVRCPACDGHGHVAASPSFESCAFCTGLGTLSVARAESVIATEGKTAVGFDLGGTSGKDHSVMAGVRGRKLEFLVIDDVSKPMERATQALEAFKGWLR